ncbi:MAG: glycosyltransferase [Hyphomonadaceae bacterium]
MPETRAPRIAYFLNRFPVLSETFVIGEIADHLEAGLDVEVFVASPPPGDGPELSAVFNDRVHYLDIPRSLWGRLTAILQETSGLIGAGRFGALRRLRPKAWASAILLARGLRRSTFRHDLVHCHFGYAGRRMAAVKSLGLIDIPIMTTFHGADISRPRHDGIGHDHYRTLFSESAACLPISEYWADALQAMGCPRSKIIVCRMGIAPLARKTPSAMSNKIRMAMTGRFVEKKGHTYALAAVAELCRRRQDMEIRFDILGDGPLLADMRRWADANGLASIVHFHGATPHRQTLSIVELADIFLLPSVTARDGDMEGIPVALMEAMAMGVPVVSTRHSGIPELVEDGRSGLLVAERDTAQLADALERLAEAPALRNLLAKNGRDKIEREFDRAKLGQALRGIYREVLSPSTTAASAGLLTAST